MVVARGVGYGLRGGHLLGEGPGPAPNHVDDAGIHGDDDADGKDEDGSEDECHVYLGENLGTTS